MTKVSGTIIFDSGKESMFLVDAQETYSFVTTRIKEDQTALASLLDYMKNTIGIPVNSLRLEELTMLKGEKKQSLFVFSIYNDSDDVRDSLAKDSTVQFVDVTRLGELFDTVELDTAPFFE